MSLESSPVWYASDRRAHSAFKVFVYDDIGSLVVDPNMVEFRSAETRLTISPVAKLQRARQSWNWVMYLLANLAMTPIYAMWWYFIAWLRTGAEQYVIVSIVALNLVGFAISRCVTWVVVTGALDSPCAPGSLPVRTEAGRAYSALRGVCIRRCSGRCGWKRTSRLTSRLQRTAAAAADDYPGRRHRRR